MKKKKLYYDGMPQVEVDALLYGLDRPIKKRKVKTITGWIGKDESLSDIAEYIKDRCLSRKGFECEWHPDHWPPRNVKITIEEL